MYVQSPNIFKCDPRPEWLSEWLDERAERAATRQTSKKKKPITASSVTQKLARRHAKTEPGLEALALRLKDVVREGLAALPGKEYQYWDTAARRLVDCGAPALAKEVFRLAEISAAEPLWAGYALSQLGQLALIVDAGRRFFELPEDTQGDLQAVFGWSQTRDDVIFQGQKVSDTWQVVGMVQEESDDDRLVMQRAWIMGADTRKTALILNFSPMGQPFKEALLPGTRFDGEIVYYPGSSPMRALVLTRGDTTPLMTLPSGYPDFQAAMAACGGALAKNPWLKRFPMLMEKIVIDADEDRFFAVDSRRHALPMTPDSVQLFKTMAMAGGQPRTLFCEWMGGELTLLPQGRIYRSPYKPSQFVSGELIALAQQLMLGEERFGDMGGTTLKGGVAALLKDIDWSDRAWGILQVAGVTGAWEQAGRRAQPYVGTLPRRCEPEALPVASEQVCQVLFAALLGEMSGLIPEILGLLSKKRLLVQPWVLPALLEHGAIAVAQREEIRDVAGKRGSWLCSHKEEWQWLSRFQTDTQADSRDSKIWDEGRLTDRVCYLKYLRRNRPDDARALLDTEMFVKESARDRDTFLNLLETGLSLADESFLERCLYDRSKVVRTTAARLLSAIDGSALGERMAGRLRQHVFVKRGMLRKTLMVELPSEPDDQAVRDGIAPEPPADQKLGKRAYWLRHIVSMTPLSFWTKEIGQTPEDVIRMAKKNEWQTLLYESLWIAAWQQRNTSWLTALSASKELDLAPAAIAQVLERIPQDARETLIRHQMVERQLTVETVSVLSGLIAECPAPWSARFGREVLYWMNIVLNRYRNRNELNWTVGESLRLIAYLLPLDVLDEAQSLTKVGTEQMAQLLERKENFYAVLTKRTVIRKELSDHE